MPTKRNWCKELAEEAIAPSVEYPTYSYCNPEREYNGETLIEVNENDYRVRTLISGSEYREYDLVISVRTQTYDDADALIQTVMELVSEYLKTEGAGYVWNEEGVTADARGIVEGESFYGYAEFTVNETVRI